MLCSLGGKGEIDAWSTESQLQCHDWWHHEYVGMNKILNESPETEEQQEN